MPAPQKSGSPAAAGPPTPPAAAVPFWQRRWSFPLLIVALNLLAGGILAGYSLANGLLAWDHAMEYSLFRSNYHSMNFYGEPMWWNPATGVGFPEFYFSHLGLGIYSVLSSAVLGTLWVLGRLGIIIQDYRPVMTVFFCFLVPLLFSTAFYLLLRQIVKNTYAKIYALIVAAFSPGVIFSLGENGLEQTAYGLLWAAAFLHFYEQPSRRGFLWLVAATAVMIVSFALGMLCWNLVFLPLFVFAVVVVGRRDIRRHLAGAWRAVPWAWWLGAAVLVATCMAPTLISYSQGEDIWRTKAQARTYPYEAILPGNPLEFLTTGIPGVGFHWEEPHAHWQLYSYIEEPDHLAYNYLGILGLPLFLLGLCAGRPPWRQRLFLLTAALVLVVCLAAWSGLFATVLAWPTPLRAVNHYSDTLFRLGTFFIMILGGALGLEALLEGGRRRALGLLFTLAATSLLGAAVLVAVYGRAVLILAMMGFFFAVTVVMGLHLVRSCRAPSYRWRRGFAPVLLALVLVDVSTIAFIHVREYMWKPIDCPLGLFNVPYADPPPGMIEMPSDVRSHIALTLLTLRAQRDVLVAGITPEQVAAMPYLSAWDSAKYLRPEDALTMDFGKLPFLPIAPGVPDSAALRPFLHDPPAEKGTIEGRVAGRTYNRLELDITANRPMLLFLRDSYFPGWKATVNGQPAEIIPALWMFKAVAVPEGRSRVTFEFSQRALGLSLLWCYAVVAGLVAVAAMARPGTVQERRPPGAA